MPAPRLSQAAARECAAYAAFGVCHARQDVFCSDECVALHAAEAMSALLSGDESETESSELEEEVVYAPPPKPRARPAQPAKRSQADDDGRTNVKISRSTDHACPLSLACATLTVGAGGAVASEKGAAQSGGHSQEAARRCVSNRASHAHRSVAEFPQHARTVLTDLAEDIEAEIFRANDRITGDKYKVVHRSPRSAAHANRCRPNSAVWSSISATPATARSLRGCSAAICRRRLSRA